MTTSTDSDAPAAASTPPVRRRRVWPRVLIAVGVVLVLIIGAATVYAVVLNNRVTANIHHEGGLLPTDPTASTGPTPTPRPTKDALETGTLNYLLLGSDSRDPDDLSKGRSDSIMLVHLNQARNKAYIISFPRDMYVQIPGHGRDKINAAFSEGGAPLTVRTLESLTGARMDHVVLVDFEGFVEMTEALGGVEVTNKTAFVSHGFDYPKGKITIEGKRALWFVRERHSLPGGDLDRAENQRNVIKAVVQKGLSPKVISDPSTFSTFIGNLAKHLTVDDTLSNSEIRSTAFSLRLSGKDIVLMQAPLAGFGMVNGQSIDRVDTVKMAELSTALKKDKLADYVKKYPQG